MYVAFVVEIISYAFYYVHNIGKCPYFSSVVNWIVYKGDNFTGFSWDTQIFHHDWFLVWPIAIMCKSNNFHAMVFKLYYYLEKNMR